VTKPKSKSKTKTRLHPCRKLKREKIRTSKLEGETTYVTLVPWENGNENCVFARRYGENSLFSKFLSLIQKCSAYCTATTERWYECAHWLLSGNCTKLWRSSVSARANRGASSQVSVERGKASAYKAAHFAIGIRFIILLQRQTHFVDLSKRPSCCWTGQAAKRHAFVKSSRTATSELWSTRSPGSWLSPLQLILLPPLQLSGEHIKRASISFSTQRDFSSSFHPVKQELASFGGSQEEQSVRIGQA